jgi:acetyl esterase/lipase
VAAPARRAALLVLLALLTAGAVTVITSLRHPTKPPRLTLSAAPASSCRVPVANAAPDSNNATAPRQETREISYGNDDGQPLTGILGEPAAGRGNHAAVLLVHGGAWVHGTPGEMAEAARAFTTAGFVTFNINYRLASAAHPGFPSELQDVRQAIRYLRAHAQSIDIDPRRIGALGSSAGGNLVTLLAASGRSSCLTGDRVAAVAAWSPPIDVAAYGRYADKHCANDLVGCPWLVQEAVHYVGCRYQACSQRWQQASVQGYASPDDPPALIFNSSKEVIALSQVHALRHALDRQHVPNQLIVFPGDRHATGYQSVALPLTVRFFERYLLPAPTSTTGYAAPPIAQ